MNTNEDQERLSPEALESLKKMLENVKFTFTLVDSPPTELSPEEAFFKKLRLWLSLRQVDAPGDVVQVMSRFIGLKRGKRIALGQFQPRFADLRMDKYTFYRTLSECCARIGEFVAAAEHAEVAGRFDLVGDNYFSANLFEKAAEAWSRHGVSRFEGRHRKLVYCTREICRAGKIANESGFRKRYATLYKELLRLYESWSTVGVLMQTPDLERFAPSANTCTCLSPKSTRSFDDLICEISEQTLEESQTPSAYDEEMQKVALHVANGEYGHAADVMGGKYLSSRNDLYFTLLLLSGRDLTKNDVLENQYFYIRRKGDLIQRIPSIFLEEIDRRLCEFASKHGMGVLAYASKTLKNLSSHNHYFSGSQYLPVTAFNNSDSYREFMTQLLGDVEEKIRERLNLQDAEERWISEKTLYEFVKAVASGFNVVRGARPTWLAGQHLDVYIPELALAFEYMGQQHYQPVSFFGGEDAFTQNQLRDRRKRDLCAANGVACIDVRFDQKWEDLEQIVRSAVSAVRSKQL